MSCIINCIETTTSSITWVEISTIAVACFAIGLTILQGIQNKRHNQLSVKPLLSVHENTTTFESNGTKKIETIELMIENNGVGPAIIKSFELHQQQNIIESPTTEDIEKAINQAITFPYSAIKTYTFKKGYAFQDRTEKRFVTINFQKEHAPTKNELKKQVKDLNYLIKYTDIYGKPQDSLDSSKE